MVGKGIMLALEIVFEGVVLDVLGDLQELDRLKSLLMGVLAGIASMNLSPRLLKPKRFF